VILQTNSLQCRSASLRFASRLWLRSNMASAISRWFVAGIKISSRRVRMTAC